MNRKQSKGYNFRIVLTLGIVFMISVSFAMLSYFLVQLRELDKQENATEYFGSHYAFITSDNQDQFYQAVYEAAKEEGEKQGCYVEYMGKNLAVNYSKSELMKIAIASKVDGIILEADESEETADLINAAVKSNIPVITVGNDCTGSTRQSYVGISNYSLGQEYGKQILTQVSDGVKKVLVLMNPNADDTSQNIIYTAIKEQLQQSADVGHFDVKTFAIDDDSTFGAEESIRDIIMDEDRLPDILICLNELNTNCAYQAVVDYNKVGSVNIFGYYMSESILDAIDKEIISSTVAIDTKQMGKYCVEAMEEYRNYGYVNEYMPVDIRIIKKTNVKEFLSDED